MNLQDWLNERFGGEAPNDIWDLTSQEGLNFVVEGELDGYDEGRVDSRYVFQDEKDDKFWSFIYSSDSWSEWSDEFSDVQITEVKPVQKMVTFYE